MPPSIKRRPLITYSHPKSPVSEAYRTLRTNIQFSSVDSELHRIMITSAGPGEGKSTTAANLAVTYAQSDKQVLLIDADLRKPTMHHTFAVSNRLGLTSILLGQCAIHDSIIETGVPNLFLLTAGPIPPNPSEILASQRMKDTLRELDEHFDQIIIDTPPLLAVTDGQITATLCDGVVMVVDSGSIKSGPALKAKESLEHVNAKILGVVLNNINRNNKEEYYYYNYYGNSEQ